MSNSITHRHAELLSVISRLDLPLIAHVDSHEIHAVGEAWKCAALADEAGIATVVTLTELHHAMADTAVRSIIIPARSIGIGALKSVISRYTDGKVIFMEAPNE